MAARRRCYDPVVNSDDVRAFARRDWAAIADAKASYWAERKRTMTVDQALAVADALRIHVRVLRPEWPDPGSRDEDMAVHERVSEALRAVSPIRSS